MTATPVYARRLVSLVKLEHTVFALPYAYAGAILAAGQVPDAQLLAWIEQTHARDIFVTGACAETIIAKLGPRARMLGPPHQMVLFPQAAR